MEAMGLSHEAGSAKIEVVFGGGNLSSIGTEMTIKP